MEFHINQYLQATFQRDTSPSSDFIAVNAHKRSDRYESQPYNHHHGLEYKHNTYNLYLRQYTITSSDSIAVNVHK